MHGKQLASEFLFRSLGASSETHACAREATHDTFNFRLKTSMVEIIR